MISFQEPIALGLSIAGVTLTFTSCTILAIPKLEIFKFLGETSDYELHRQEISFQASVDDLAVNSIDVNQEFTLTDGTYTYTFGVFSIIPDFTGFATLNATYISKA